MTFLPKFAHSFIQLYLRKLSCFLISRFFWEFLRRFFKNSYTDSLRNVLVLQSIKYTRIAPQFPSRIVPKHFFFPFLHIFLKIFTENSERDIPEFYSSIFPEILLQIVHDFFDEVLKKFYWEFLWRLFLEFAHKFQFRFFFSDLLQITHGFLWNYSR